jgi:hypothetical protein
MPLVAADMGKRAAELATVAPGQQGSSRHDDEKYTPPKDTRLRAILRAPEPIQDLYRDGLVSQTAAATGPRPP